MAEYKSNYTGQQIDTAIGKANTALQTETDPIFSASASAGITSQDITNWNGKSDFSGSYNDLTDKPTIPDVSNFITKDVNDLTYYELKTAVGNSIVMSMDSSTYVLTVSLKNSAGTVLNTQTVDLPLETMVVSGSYDSTNKKIILTLKNGQTVEFSVADLVSGLQSEITSSNKLSADLVDDTTSTNKFVSASDKTTWDGKYTKPSGGIPSTDLSSAVQTSLGKADTALQSETYTGTITGITMNGTSKGTSGVVDLGTVITDISGKQDIIQYSSMPTASASTVGKIVQFIGTTDSTYTNGYFYKCVSDGQATPTYSWQVTQVQESGNTEMPIYWVDSWQTYVPIAEFAKKGLHFYRNSDTTNYQIRYKMPTGINTNTYLYGVPIYIIVTKDYSEWTSTTDSGGVFGYIYYADTYYDGDIKVIEMQYTTVMGLQLLYPSNVGYQILKSSGSQTIGGTKTFSSFPITPSSAPTTDYQTANKKYVDDQISLQIGNINTILATLTTPSSNVSE